MSFLRVLTGICVTAGIVSAWHRPQPLDDHMMHMSAADLAAPRAAVGGTEQGDRAFPASNNNTPARLAASPRHGEWVKVAWEPGSKDSLMAWIVYPSTTRAKSPVVVVIHEIFGLSTWIRGVADQVAAEGFISIAPDLNSRVRGGPSSDELSGDSANKLSRLVPAAERNRAISAVAGYAMAQASADQHYAVIGYCYGGQTVFMHAVNGGIKGFSGGVAFYGWAYPKMVNGAQVPDRDSLTKIKVPVMLLSGSKDGRIGAVMPALDTAMKELGKNYWSKNYEGAAHGFLRLQDDPKTPPDPAEGPANVAATKDGWPRTVEFLKKNLGLK